MAKILIVEDSQSMATAQAYRLWESGHTVTFAANGKEALDHCRADTFDVILLDHELPDISGLEIYRAVRQMGLRASVVMITGKGDERLAAQILKEGAKDYLPKSEGLLDMLPGVIARILQEEEAQRLLAAKDLELKRAHEQLEQKVAERTTELMSINERLEQEISYRRRVETALLESNRLMLSILDSVSDGFISIDEHFYVTYFNRAAEALLQTQNAGTLGRNLFEIMPWAAGSELEGRLNGSMETHCQACFEMRIDVPALRDCLNLKVYPQPVGFTVQLQIAPRSQETGDVRTYRYLA